MNSTSADKSKSWLLKLASMHCQIYKFDVLRPHASQSINCAKHYHFWGQPSSLGLCVAWVGKRCPFCCQQPGGRKVFDQSMAGNYPDQVNRSFPYFRHAFLFPTELVWSHVFAIGNSQFMAYERRSWVKYSVACAAAVVCWLSYVRSWCDSLWSKNKERLCLFRSSHLRSCIAWAFNTFSQLSLSFCRSS